MNGRRTITYVRLNSGHPVLNRSRPSSFIPCEQKTVIDSTTPTETRVIDMFVPGPAHRSIAPASMRQAALKATADRPNRLGSEQVPVRLYEPQIAPSGALTKPSGEPWATLIWAHGGSFMRGDLDWPESDWVAHQFAGHGVRVIAVDYALASDTVKAPAPANDVAAVLRWVESRYGGAILVGGASAGANLAAEAAIIQAAVAEAGIAGPSSGVIMMYPTLHRKQRPNAAIAQIVTDLPEIRRFSAERIAEMYRYYLAEEFSPSADEDLKFIGGPRTEQVPTTGNNLAVEAAGRTQTPSDSIPLSETAGLARDVSQDSDESDEVSTGAPTPQLSPDGSGSSSSDSSTLESGSVEAAAAETETSHTAVTTATGSLPRTAAAGEASASLAEITALIEQIRSAQTRQVSDMPYAEVDEISEFPTTPVVIGELQTRQLSKLPTTIIVNAEADELRASGEQFAQQLRDSGVTVYEHIQGGTIHGFLNRPEESPKTLVNAKAAVRVAVQDLRSLLGISG